jgi:hypothetical protein
MTMAVGLRFASGRLKRKIVVYHLASAVYDVTTSG